MEFFLLPSIGRKETNYIIKRNTKRRFSTRNLFTNDFPFAFLQFVDDFLALIMQNIRLALFV